MKYIKLLLPINLAFLLVACSSHQPTSFYQLKAMETADIEANKLQAEETTVLINPIKFPEYLDRPQLIIRDNDYKLQLSENHRWAEPLKNEFFRVLMENINNRLAPGHAVNYSELNSVNPAIHVSIEVLQLDVSIDNQAVLSVKWILNKDKTIKRYKHQYTIAVTNKNYQSRVEAQSKTVSLFADQLVKTMATFQQAQQ